MKKILIIESDGVIRGIYRRKFEMSGYAVEAVSDGPGAMQLLSTFKPDLIQMDIVLKSGSGVEVIREIRALPGFKTVPILVLSSFYRPDIAKEAWEAGATKCVSKMDCTPNLALEIVEQALNPGAPTAPGPPGSGATGYFTKSSFATAAPFTPAPSFSTAPPFSTAPSFATAPPFSPATPFTTAPESASLPGSSAEGFSTAPPFPLAPRNPVPFQTSIPPAPASSPPPAAPAPGEEAKSQGFGEGATGVTSAFRMEIRQEFLKRVPQIQADLRDRVGALMRSKSTTDQLSLLLELNASIFELSGLAGITGFTRIAHLSGAMDVLIKDLQKKPQQMTSSVLRTIAHASDCLNMLFRNLNQSPQDAPQSSLILAVDDEPISRRTVTIALSKASLRCIALEDAKMALKVLGENQFDLIFLDAEMPEMNGFELCTELRKLPSNKTTPVIFVTSLTNFEIRAQSSLSGGNDLIAKPFLMMELAVKALTYLLKPKASIGEGKGRQAPGGAPNAE